MEKFIVSIVMDMRFPVYYILILASIVINFTTMHKKTFTLKMTVGILTTTIGFNCAIVVMHV